MVSHYEARNGLPEVQRELDEQAVKPGARQAAASSRAASRTAPRPCCPSWCGPRGISRCMGGWRHGTRDSISIPDELAAELQRGASVSELVRGAVEAQIRGRVSSAPGLK